MRLLAGVHDVVAFNAALDRRVLRQTCQRFNPIEIAATWHCALEQHSAWVSEW